MSDQIPQGCFHLKQGIKLIAAPGGGVVLQTQPLRALKINAAAFDLLQQCENGLCVDALQGAETFTGIMHFLDRLHQGGMLAWRPPATTAAPLVSIIVPVYNRPAEIEACLTSLQALDYPRDRMEIIVVDDASQDHSAASARRFGVQLIVQPHNMGQSAARNAGVAAARGEIIAFIDSDCTADPAWLRELLPCFGDPRVTLVGGYVDAFYRETRLERYEEVCSALHMGDQTIIGRGANAAFYVPTCNMLLRKTAFEQIGGLDETLRVGEDVDLCWRLLGSGHHLMYVPTGRVRHKHRTRCISAFRRRFDYGTSEAVLYRRFPEVSKQFPWQTGAIAVLLAATAALATRSLLWLAVCAAMMGIETLHKKYRLRRKMGIILPYGDILAALAKSHLHLACGLMFYAVRYHLVVLMVLLPAVSFLAPLWLAIILLPITVAYAHKKPRLSFPVFAFFYAAEQIFYQCGVFWGCIKQKNFRLYGIAFRYAGFLQRAPKRSIRPAAAPMKTGKAADCAP